MYLVKRGETDPYFNIAAEEYFLKNFNEEFVMLWQNEPSVVVGKHQNTWAEVNHRYISKNNIPVIRRITGGGTVYHDLGNINYTFITSSPSRDKLVDFKLYTKPLIDFLETLGLRAEFTGKNNITLNGKKISGNSAHVYKNRVIHHGTILINSDLDVLELSIAPGKFSITDKAVKSIRATVTNLNNELKDSLSIDDFSKKYADYLCSVFNITDEYTLSVKDKEEIEKLINDKYKTWEWNYGYSPSYTIQNEIDDIEIKMVVDKGIIADIAIRGRIERSELVSKLMLNLPFNKSHIENCFSSLGLTNKSRKKYYKLLGI